ncbi:Protein YciI [Gracilariopsis chorda]|uniref:Protein YciI n=1 Tax=Gracilariopsis chorda TaxID=448386 RepID=A0A2V3ILJ5_9FLOR|nr:Protein YciI [Gracilariopsis chorda]|eukprot:PXF42955.1 Protein YciI [Gracilariopsis chorda]
MAFVASVAVPHRVSSPLRSAFLPAISTRPARTSSPFAAPAMSASHPLFAAFCKDVADSAAKRANAREAHLQYIRSDEFATFFAGPLKQSPTSPFEASLIIIKSPDYNTAKRKFELDPYAEARVFESTHIRQWRCGMTNTPLPAQLFMVWCVDKPRSLQLRADTRAAHLQWWKLSHRKGIIGPFPCQGGANGTLIVCSGDSVDEVRQWAATDPYYKAQLFDSVTVLECKNVVDNVSHS